MEKGEFSMQNTRKIHVFQTLKTMNVDFEVDPYGDIIADYNRWEVVFPEEDSLVILVTFAKTMSAGSAADIAIRFAWPLQNAGFIVTVNPGYFEPRARV
jgi:hypothetical protein